MHAFCEQGWWLAFLHNFNKEETTVAIKEKLQEGGGQADVKMGGLKAARSLLLVDM